MTHAEAALLAAARDYAVALERFVAESDSLVERAKRLGLAEERVLAAALAYAVRHGEVERASA